LWIYKNGLSIELATFTNLYPSITALPLRKSYLVIRYAQLHHPLAGLGRVIIHGSLLPAIAPQTFPGAEFGSSASLVVRCGFARVDTVRGRGVATLGRYPHCFVQVWQPAMR
jgi:hypothetical protein